MDLIQSIFNFFTNRQIKFSHKTFVVILVFVIVIFIDNTLNFSEHYNNSRKLEQIESINKILLDSSLLSNEKKILINKRYILLTSKTWKDRTCEYIFSINFNKTDQPRISDPTHPPITNDRLKDNTERIYWIHFVTSNCFILILMILFPIFLIKNKKHNFLDICLVVAFFYFLLFCFSLVFAKILSYIPILFDNVIYNYIANTVINILIIALLIYLGRKNKTSENKD